MKRHVLLAISPTLIPLLLGCGAYFSLSRSSVSSATDPETIRGVPVNRRTTYSVTFSSQNELISYVKASPGSDKLDGIDCEYLDIVDLTRLPFSSGKLGITLGGDQIPRKIEISSQPGTERAIGVEKTRLEGRQKVEEAESKSGK